MPPDTGWYVSQLLERTHPLFHKTIYLAHISHTAYLMRKLFYRSKSVLTVFLVTTPRQSVGNSAANNMVKPLLKVK